MPYLCMIKAEIMGLKQIAFTAVFFEVPEGG
jgi:hypothetical protein